MKKIVIGITLVFIILSSCGISRSDFIFNVKDTDISFSEDNWLLTIDYKSDVVTNKYNNDDFLGYDFYYKIYETDDANITNDKKNGNSIDYFKNAANRFFRLQSDGNESVPGLVVNDLKALDFQIKLFWNTTINQGDVDPVMQVFVGDVFNQTKDLKRVLPDTTGVKPYLYKNFWKNDFYINDADIPPGLVQKINEKMISGKSINIAIVIYMFACAKRDGIDIYSEPICITKDSFLKYSININSTE